MDENYFARLFQVNVNEHVQTKGQFRFLSWPYAVAQLRLHDPAATSATERRVLQEILQSTFGDAFLQGLELNDVLGTFQDFIHNDPALKEIMDRFIQDLAGPPRA